MQLNAEFHQQPRCRFAFNNLYVDLVDSSVEASISGIEHAENALPPFTPYLNTVKNPISFYIGGAARPSI
jgi:hypothetical protein